MKRNYLFSKEYQSKWTKQQLFDPSIVSNVGSNVKLHNQINHPLSSAASCLNVLGYLSHPNRKEELKRFLNFFDIGVENIIDFPGGVNLGGEEYDDSGNVIFEWIGPRNSPINESGGSRGQNRTSIDAYILANIGGKITQLLIEWKFTEKYDKKNYFSGTRGIERLRRYSDILTSYRKEGDYFPFDMKEEGGLSLFDFGYAPFYQLLRMHLLAKETTPIGLTSDLRIEDYRIIHLTHSLNTELNTLDKKQLQNCPNLLDYQNRELHEVWNSEILNTNERNKFIAGYWDQALPYIQDSEWKNYCIKRYIPVL